MVVAARSSGVCQKLELSGQVAIAGQLWHVTPVSDGCVTLPLIVRQLSIPRPAKIGLDFSLNYA